MSGRIKQIELFVLTGKFVSVLFFISIFLYDFEKAVIYLSFNSHVLYLVRV